MAMRLNISPAEDPLTLCMPSPYRCGIAFTFDADMCHGYSPLNRPGCHGRIAPFLATHMRRMMDVAESLDIHLHWFAIVNPYGFYLHDPQSRFLQEMLSHIRGTTNWTTW